MSAADKKKKPVAKKGTGGGSRGGGTITLLLIFLIIAIGNLGYGVFQSQSNQVRLTKAGNLRVLSQQVAKNATEASSGTPLAFDLLESSIKEFEAQFNHLSKGDNSQGLAASPIEILNTEVKQVGDLWRAMKNNAEKVSAGRETIINLYQIQGELSDSIPQMEFLYTNVQDVLLDTRGAADQVMLATRQSYYLERIIRSFQKVLKGSDDAEVAAENFGQDVDLFGGFIW